MSNNSDVIRSQIINVMCNTVMFLILNKTRRSFALFSLAQTSLKNNDLIHQDNNLLLGVRLRSVHDRFYHFNLVCPLAVICTKCERGIT